MPTAAVVDFGPVERTLAEQGEALHPDVRMFYGSFRADGIKDRHSHSGSGDTIFLSTARDAEDLRRKIEGLAAGALAQIAESQPITFVVAATGSGVFFALDNATGAIHVQEPFELPGVMVAPSLAEFLKRLGSEA